MLYDINHILIIYQEASTPDLSVPTRLEVAAASRPKQLIVTALKRKEKEKTGQPYKPSKKVLSKVRISIGDPQHSGQ